MEVTINIPGLENLTAAINHLTVTIGDASDISVTTQAPASQMVPMQNPSQTTVLQQPISTAAQQQAAHTMPMPAQAPVAVQAMQQNPFQQPVQSPVPTTAVPQEYSQDQIAVAMTGLVDRGMQPQVMGLLNAMGCQTLMQVPKERYPELVLKLREMGAVI